MRESTDVFESSKGKGTTHFWWWVGLVCVAGLLCMSPLVSNDLWWHLSYGRWIWEHGHVPVVDVFTWTHAGLPVAHIPWLSGLLFYGVYKGFGVAGLVGLKGLFGWIWAGSSWQWNRQQRVSGLWWGLIFVLCFLLVNSRLVMLRALVTPFVLLPLLCFLWERGRHSTHSVWRWMIPFVMVIWVNAHGSFPLPLLWLGLHLFWPLLWDAEERKRSLGPNLTLLCVVLLATLLTPTGFALWKVVFTLSTQSGEFLNYQLTQEMLPLRWERLIGLRVPFLVLMLFGLPALVGLSWKKYGHQFLFWMFVCAMAFKSQRFVGIVGLVTLLYLPHWLDALSVGFEAPERFASLRGRLAVRGLLGVFALVLCGAPVWSWWYSNSAQPSLFPSALGFSIAQHRFPAASVSFLRHHRPKGMMYNSFFTGGYLYWMLPGRRVFADGRTNLLFQDKFFYQNYGRHRLGDGKLWMTLARWKVSIAIVEHGPLGRSLRGHRDWALVSMDDMSAMFLRRGGGNDALILKTEYRELFLTPVLDELIARYKSLRRHHPRRFDRLVWECRRALRLAPYPSRHLSVALRLALAIRREVRPLPRSVRAHRRGRGVSPASRPFSQHPGR